MPELPELEELVRNLSPSLIGRTIQSVQVHKPQLFNAAPGLTLEDLFGRRIERIWRRGKYTIWELAGDLDLIIHLKLAGQMVHIAKDGHELGHGGHPIPMWGTPMPHKSSHVVFCLDDSSILYLTDIRQFARLHLMPRSEVEKFIKGQRIGVEPLTRRFTAKALAAKLRRRTIPLKTTIMDQSVVGGIGNIYADESLWKARLHPRRAANSLSDAEITRLHRAIRAVLDYAVREGPAFVPRDKVIGDREFPYVHGRAGARCPRCGGVVLKEYVGGRATYFCPKCQKLAVSNQLSAVSGAGNVATDG